MLATQPTGEVTVQMTTDLSGADLSVSPTQVVFTQQDWNEARTISVVSSVDGDMEDEPEIVLTHSASGGGYGAVEVPGVTVRVLDGKLPVLRVAEASAEESDGSLVFNVSLSLASGEEVTVDHVTSDGSARAGRDYTLTTGTLTFPAGTTRGTIAVPLIDDDLDEEAETFQVELFDPVNAVLSSAVGGRLTQTGTILDDDYPQVGVSFGASAYRVREGGRVTIQLRLSRDPGRLVEVGVRAAGGRGVQSTDFTVPTTVVFEAGETSQRMEFVSTADRFDENDEVVVLSFTSLPAGFIPGNRPEVTITITDDDERGITISEEAMALVEGQSAQYRIGLTSQPTGTLALDILASPPGSDVTVTPSSLVFTQEDWWVGRTVLVAAGQDDDALQDPVVTLGHRATGGDYTGFRAGTVRVTVTEDDAPTLSIADARETEGAGEIAFEVTLDVQTDREVRASYVTLGGTATEGVDYVLARGTLVIPRETDEGPDHGAVAGRQG